MHGKIRLARKWYTKSNHVSLNETWVGEVTRPFHCNLSPKPLSPPRSRSGSGFGQHWAGRAGSSTEQRALLPLGWPRREPREDSHLGATTALAEESEQSLYSTSLSWGTAEIFHSLPEIHAKLWNIFKYRLTLISPFFQNFPFSHFCSAAGQGALRQCAMLLYRNYSVQSIINP